MHDADRQAHHIVRPVGLRPAAEGQRSVAHPAHRLEQVEAVEPRHQRRDERDAVRHPPERGGLRGQGAGRGRGHSVRRLRRGASDRRKGRHGLLGQRGRRRLRAGQEPGSEAAARPFQAPQRGRDVRRVVRVVERHDEPRLPSVPAEVEHGRVLAHVFAVRGEGRAHRPHRRAAHDARNRRVRVLPRRHRACRSAIRPQRDG